MKLAVRRTYLGDRLCFAEVVQGRLVDVQGTHAHQLHQAGMCRDDAIARAQREIGPDLPALLRTEPDLTIVRKVHEHAVAAGQSGDLPQDYVWSTEPNEWGVPVGRPRTIWGMDPCSGSAERPVRRRTDRPARRRPPAAERAVATRPRPVHTRAHPAHRRAA
jgi:hypothetical protein